MASTPARALARRGLAYYFAVLLVASAALEGTMLRSGRPIEEQTTWASGTCP